MQLDLFSEINNQPQWISIKDGEYLFIPGFFTIGEANEFFKTLLNDIKWKQESMKIYGKDINFPRLTSWYGDNDKAYTFSGITLEPHEWSDTLMKIRNKIEPLASTSFNSVLLNLYRDGNDSISWHTDAEKELGTNPIIASVNFGATRTFQLRHIESKERIDIELTHGSLLIMGGSLQHYWQHQVPKTKKRIDKRINLTFRVIK